MFRFIPKQKYEESFGVIICCESEGQAWANGKFLILNDKEEALVNTVRSIVLESQVSGELKFEVEQAMLKAFWGKG
jgi:hypothetical protein